MKVNDYDFVEDLYYSKHHIWAKVEAGFVRVGITDFMQKHVGKIVFFSARPVGTRVEQGKPLGTIETGKWVGPIRSPVTGTISEVNANLRANVGLIHTDPYGKGWLVVIKPEKLEEELKSLLHQSVALEWYKADIEKYKVTGELPKA